MLVAVGLIVRVVPSLMFLPLGLDLGQIIDATGPDDVKDVRGTAPFRAERAPTLPGVGALSWGETGAAVVGQVLLEGVLELQPVDGAYPAPRDPRPMPPPVRTPLTWSVNPLPACSREEGLRVSDGCGDGSESGGLLPQCQRMSRRRTLSRRRPSVGAAVFCWRRSTVARMAATGAALSGA